MKNEDEAILLMLDKPTLKKYQYEYAGLKDCIDPNDLSFELFCKQRLVEKRTVEEIAYIFEIFDEDDDPTDTKFGAKIRNELFPFSFSTEFRTAIPSEFCGI